MALDNTNTDVEAQAHSAPERQSAAARPQHPQLPVTRIGSIPQPLPQPVTTTADRQSPDLTHPQRTETTDPLPQATSTIDNVRPVGDDSDPQRGEKYSDSSDGLWSMYLTEAEKQDKEVTESWKGDTDGILVFTGLFSATVAGFIIESYKRLSPDPSATTNMLLTQLSVQLVNISKGIPLADVTAQSNQPFKPTASAVRVNVFLFLSLVLSLSCALSATLMQQWARRYQELAQYRGAPHRRARIRAFISHGIRRFGMTRAVATMPMLLHLSVFLFFTGLIEFLFPINTAVSYITLGSVVAFSLAYATLTVLPNLYLNCPYDTPLSGFTWRLSQISAIGVFEAGLRIEALFHNFLLRLWSRVNQHATGRVVERWREALKNHVKLHRQWLSDGLRKSVERSAKEAPSSVVASALKWTLTALDEDKEIEEFAAGVPGFFDSRAVLDSTSAILPLMSEKLPTDTILGSRLYDLLNTCVPGTSFLHDEERKSRLRVCLKCLCYLGRAYNVPGTSEPLPSYVPLTLASPDIIRLIQIEQDPDIRVMGRCFGTSVAVKMAASLKPSADSNVQVSDEELACLSAILGSDSHDVKLCLRHPGTVEIASMVSFALGDIGSLVADAVPSDVRDVVQRTLDILSQSLPTEETAALHLDQSITPINEPDGKFDRIIVSHLHNLLRLCASGTPPFTDEVRKSCLRVCLKSLWYCARAYLGASNPLPSYFPRVLATPEMTHYIQRENDHTSHVIGCCFEALVVTKLASDFNSGTVRVRNQELVACLSAILGAESRMVELWLRQPGAIPHMGLFSLALGEVGSIRTSRIGSTEQSDMVDVVQQTFSILAYTLPSGLNAKPWLYWTAPSLPAFGGKFKPILQYQLKQLLKLCTIGTPLSSLTTEVRLKCLKSLWYYGIACHHLRVCKSLSAWDVFLVQLATPKIARHIRNEEDLVCRVIGRCFGSLIISKLVAEFTSCGDHELACLSALLRIGKRKLVHWLDHPGAVQLLNMLSLTFGEVSSFVTNAVPLDALHIVGQTISILTQAFPVELKTELQLDQSDALMNASDSVFLLHHLLKTCALRTLSLPEEVRTSCLQMCLNYLWYWGKALHKVGASQPLPPGFLDLAGREISSLIRVERDQASRVMARCVEALVINILLAHFRSRTDSTVLISDEALAFLSAILNTEDHDVKLWHGQPGAIDLVNIVFLAFGDIGSLATDTVPSYVLDVVPGTFSILSQALPTELNAELVLDQTHSLVDSLDGTSPMMGEMYQNHSFRCLMNLWRFVRAYNQPGNSEPLPSYVLVTFASPAMTRRIQKERDITSHVIGRCVGALIVKKIVSGIKSHSDPDVKIRREELACLSTILGTKIHNMKHCLRDPGVIELASTVSLALGDVGSLAANAVSSHVLDVIQQTLDILSQSLPCEETPGLHLDQPIAQITTWPGNFDRIIVSRLHDFLQTCVSGTSPLADDVRRNCLRVLLRSLWYCARAYHRLGTSKPLPSYFFLILATPEITHLIQAEKDPIVHVMGRCFEALVVNNLELGFQSRTDSTVQINDKELACLSAILDAKCHDVKIWLRLPGTVALASMASLTFTEPFAVLDVVVHQTLAILSKSLPPELNAKPQLDHRQAEPQTSVFHGQFERTIVSRLYDLFEACTRPNPRLAEEVRTVCLRMCLKSLWHHARAYHQQRASELLPPYTPLTLGGPQMIRRIHSEQDPAVRVIGRCFEALIVNHLAARVKSSANSTSLINDKALDCLLTILGTKSDEVVLWTDQPGAVELANMVSLIFSDLLSNTAPSDVQDIVQQTFSILSWTLPAELNAELWQGIKVDSLANSDSPDGTSPLTEPTREDRSLVYLKYLWHCAVAYNQLAISVPLPSFIRITLSRPEIARCIRPERDLAARIIGRCFEALIVNKLVDDFNSRTTFRNGVYDAQLAYILSILDVEPHELLRWPRLSTAIKLRNMVSLVSGDIEVLFTLGPTPADVLDIVQQTLNILSPDLVRGSAFEDLPIDQVVLLREICSRIANAQPPYRLNEQTAEILYQLQQISKRLSTAEYRIRRCASSIFDPQTIRRRSDLATVPVSRTRRRSRSM